MLHEFNSISLFLLLQVLASRCVSWETDESFQNALGYAGLARQVSTLLTNHLARATECSGNEAAGSEALQEVLSLLNNLSRYVYYQLRTIAGDVFNCG